MQGEQVLRELREHTLSNDTLFEFIDPILKLNPNIQSYIEINTQDIPMNGKMTLPVAWCPVSSTAYARTMRQQAGSYNPYQKCLVIVIDEKTNKFHGDMIERLVCCNKQCPNGDEHGKLIPCKKCNSTFYCDKDCWKQHKKDGHHCKKQNPIWHVI